MQVTLDIPSYLIDYAKTKNLTIEEFILKSLHLELTSDPWKKHIELKLCLIQKELDDHRIATKESNLELDANVTNRMNKERSLLDANLFIDLQQSPSLPNPNPKQTQTDNQKKSCKPVTTKTGSSVEMLDVKNLL